MLPTTLGSWSLEMSSRKSNVKIYNYVGPNWEGPDNLLATPIMFSFRNLASLCWTGNSLFFFTEYFDCLRPIGPSENGDPPYTIIGYTHIINISTTTSWSINYHVKISVAAWLLPLKLNVRGCLAPSPKCPRLPGSVTHWNFTFPWQPFGISKFRLREVLNRPGNYLHDRFGYDRSRNGRGDSNQVRKASEAAWLRLFPF